PTVPADHISRPPAKPPPRVPPAKKNEARGPALTPPMKEMWGSCQTCRCKQNNLRGMAVWQPAPRCSRRRRICLFRINAQISNCLFNAVRFDVAAFGKLIERSQRDEYGIDFEITSQGRAILARPKAVAAERRQPARHPALDQFGQ